MEKCTSCFCTPEDGDGVLFAVILYYVFSVGMIAGLIVQDQERNGKAGCLFRFVSSSCLTVSGVL